MKKLLCAMILFSSAYASASSCDFPQTQGEMTKCAAVSFQEADLELNQTYKKVLKEAGLSASQKESLRESQRSWISYKEDFCNFRAELIADGGTMMSSIKLSCLTSLTKEKTQDLKDIFNF